MPAPAVAVAEKPKRGGRKKLALAEVEEEVADKVEEEAAAAPEVVAEAPVKRAGRRKAAAPLEEEVAAVAPSPIKRGRRGAASMQKEEEEVKAKSPMKRGKKAAIEKTAVAEEIRFGMKQHQFVIWISSGLNLNFSALLLSVHQQRREEKQLSRKHW